MPLWASSNYRFHMSNSPALARNILTVIKQTDSSSPLFVSRGGRRSFPSLTHLRLRSAEWRDVLVCPPLSALVALRARRLQRSTWASSPGTVVRSARERSPPRADPGVFSTSRHPTASPSKGSLRSKSGRGTP